MSEFIIHINKKKTRKQKLGAYWFVVAGLFLIVAGLLEFVDGYELNKRFYFFNIVFLIMGVNYLWAAIRRFRDMIRQRFVEITETKIGWRIYQNPVSANWHEIQWIKKEKNNSLTIWEGKSFCKILLLNDVAEPEANEIFTLLQEYAIQRGIHLINFSEPILATA